MDIIKYIAMSEDNAVSSSIFLRRLMG